MHYIAQMLKIIFLSPLSLLYWLGLSAIRLAYRLGLFKTSYFDHFTTIKIGNLSTGGTGKTPHVAFLLHELLKKQTKVSIVSRGYGRNTAKMMRVSSDSTALSVGDEPMQLFLQQPDAIIYVASHRAEALQAIQTEIPDCRIALLDDGMQHWRLRADQNILLTCFDSPFFSDFLLPVGNLRETRSGAARADLIIVSKCPPNLPADLRQHYQTQCQRYAPHTPVLFSYYNYSPPYLLSDVATLLDFRALAQSQILLLTAIANVDYMLDFLHSLATKIQKLSYPDHHNYTQTDIKEIIDKAQLAHIDCIITTEKDATRLFAFAPIFNQAQIPVFVLPIQVNFHDYDAQILNDWLQKSLKTTN
jgi:tetraacyldisaccharide 4'-kinase